MLLKFQILPSGTLHNGFKFFWKEQFLILCSRAATANFWQARPSQWRPHQWHAADAPPHSILQNPVPRPWRPCHTWLPCSCISMTNLFYFQVIVGMQDFKNKYTLSETVSPHCIVGTQCTLSNCLEAKMYVWVGMEGIQKSFKSEIKYENVVVCDSIFWSHIDVVIFKYLHMYIYQKLKMASQCNGRVQFFYAIVFHRAVIRFSNLGVLIVIDCLFLFLSSILKPQISGVIKHPQHPL